MITLITRNDDFGSARAANGAIMEAVEEGFVKNVSCMAVGPHIDVDAAQLEELCKKKNACIGLHAAINAEWDYLKFLPALPAEQIQSLVAENGIFKMHPMMYEKQMPVVEEIMKEIRAQLDVLTRLGLTVSYVDTHMLPDAIVPGLKQEISRFAEEKGLADQRWFYTFPSERQPVPECWTESSEEIFQAYEKWFDSMEENHQYISIMHPAKMSMETKMFRNMVLKGDSVAKSRDAEYRVLISGKLSELAEKAGVKLIRYTDAIPQGDSIQNALKHM